MWWASGAILRDCIHLWPQYVGIHWWNRVWQAYNIPLIWSCSHRKDGFRRKAPSKRKTILCCWYHVHWWIAGYIHNWPHNRRRGILYFYRALFAATITTFNGTNPRSVVIMYNASIHHMKPAVWLIEEHGAILHFLPPYSPDLDPIEETFSKVKHFLRSNDPIFQVCEDSDIKDIILQGFAAITPDDCYGWMQNSGYIK